MWPRDDLFKQYGSIRKAPLRNEHVYQIEHWLKYENEDREDKTQSYQN